jgi:enediyne biosynthesis protein E5
MADRTMPQRSALVSWILAKRLEPRYLIAFLITVVLVVAQFRYHVVGGYERLALALGTCMATEALLSWFVRGKIANLQSAYISGISLTLLIKPQGAALWPFLIGGFLAIASKYVLQYRDNHLWNPTNFAIVVLLLVAPERISVLSHQWGNDLGTNLVIWIFGLLIVSRVGVLHISLTYVASFLLLNGLRSVLLGQPLVPEIAPITGPMYQLFVFFMITDPRTVVRARRWQLAVVVIIALVESLIRYGSDQAWPLPTAFNAAPALVALALVGPIAKWIDLHYGRRAAAPSIVAATAGSPPARSASSTASASR